MVKRSLSVTGLVLLSGLAGASLVALTRPDNAPEQPAATAPMYIFTWRQVGGAAPNGGTIDEICRSFSTPKGSPWEIAGSYTDSTGHTNLIFRAPLGSTQNPYNP